MLRRISVISVILMFSLSKGLLCSFGGSFPKKPADMVFRNGAVYTMDAARSWAEAVAISGGSIGYVGYDRDIQAWIGPKTKVIDLNGRMLLPGFHDSHMHPIEGGIGLSECNLSACTNELQILDVVKSYALARPKAPWILGSGWALTIFSNASPSRLLLDQIIPDRPVFLNSADGHSAWVNTRALEIAGITRNTPEPSSGRIERDPTSGEPSGILRENAKGLIEKYLPKHTQDDLMEGAKKALTLASRFGITSLQEARADEDMLRAYRELDQRGQLNVRVGAAVWVQPELGTGQVSSLVKLRRQYHGHYLHANAAKIFADGVIESHTAWLLEPYLDSKEDRGKSRIDPEPFKQLARALDHEGFQIHVHAIGDRAIRESLDALEFARFHNGPRDSRHHIAHIELFNPADIPRFRELGVIANFQPLWAYPEPAIKDLTEPVLGPARSRWLYPIRSMARTGAMIVCGSDWDVSSMNPLEAIQVALTRRGLEEKDGPAWIPEETVDLATMLAAYTINGAYLEFAETQTGSIEVGKWADLIVINRNLFRVSANQIHSCKVLITLLEGRLSWRDPEFK
jgi:predicted amidohydrolase YtcJ